MTTKPAILGGAPVFKKIFPLSRPVLPDIKKLEPALRDIFSSGLITNAKYVSKFEDGVARYLEAPYTVAVSNCTSGLILLLKVLDLKGEIICPSFTFTASGHAILWNNLKPIFVDVQPDTFNINVSEVKAKISSKTAGIMGVHIFGNPCDIRALEGIAQSKNLRLIFDSAHAFGSRYKGAPIGGFGTAEVFSLSPTKLITSGEGGIVSTKDKRLADELRLARNYGITSDYDSVILGINARMSELHAILGLHSLRMADKCCDIRNRLVSRFTARLGNMRGVRFQKINPGCRSTFKDFNMLIDGEKFGLTRDEAALALKKENIQIKQYYDPPVHRQSLYRDYVNKAPLNLSVTDKIARESITLPLFAGMTFRDVDAICLAIERIYNYRAEIKQASLRRRQYERDRSHI